MSLCYDFHKWTMISLVLVAVSFTIGLINIAYGQNTSSSMVDKLINNTKQEIAKENQYKTELINRIQNSTCLSVIGIQGSGTYILFDKPVLNFTVVSKINLDLGNTTEDLERLLQRCVIEGLIK